MSTQLIRQTARSVTSVTVITSLPVPVTICVPLPHGGVTFLELLQVIMQLMWHFSVLVTVTVN